MPAAESLLRSGASPASGFRRTFATMGLLAGMILATSGIREEDRVSPSLRRARARAVAEYRRVFDRLPATQIWENFVLLAETPGNTLNRARNTTARVVRAMREEFVSGRPSPPVQVFLFDTASTYEIFVRATRRTKPHSPYGFYDPAQRKVVLNFSTLSGSLAHELIHPLLSDDFPSIPAWLNEGIASLAEQADYRDGKMRGQTRWRLLGKLQRALRQGTAPALDDVLHQTPREFYCEGMDLRYAVARYLCLYLQQKDLLADYYRSFRECAAVDPAGARTLERVTGRSLDALQKEWELWTLSLEAEENR